MHRNLRSLQRIYLRRFQRSILRSFSIKASAAEGFFACFFAPKKACRSVSGTERNTGRWVGYNQRKTGLLYEAMSHNYRAFHQNERPLILLVSNMSHNYRAFHQNERPLILLVSKAFWIQTSYATSLYRPIHQRRHHVLF